MEQTSQAEQQADVSALLRKVIDKSPARHKINLLFIVWPPLILMLDCLTRRVTAKFAPEQSERIISRAVMAGLKAADHVGGYTKPAWPIRVVDAFSEHTIKFVSSHCAMSCKSGINLCGALNECRLNDKTAAERNAKTATINRTLRERSLMGE